jgi:hypothetical protein
MAKISTYAQVSPPNLSDMLIGTDSQDSNATKNFTISEVLDLINDAGLLSQFVPYEGANNNVDLGSYQLYCGGIFLGGPIEEPNGCGDEGDILISLGQESAPRWVSPQVAINSPKGSFFDTANQPLTGGANVGIPVILNSADLDATSGVSVVSDGSHLTRITPSYTGVYNIMFSAQLANSGGSSQTVDFWLRKNGTTSAADVANTNGKVTLQGNANYLIAAWNYFLQLEEGEYVQLMWSATSTNITMVSAAANGVHPATPSIIVTINKV